VRLEEYTKTVQTAEARYNALDTENARLKGELADAGKRNEQLTADRTQLERTLTMKSGELGQRVSALEGDNARLTKELAEAQKAREEKMREVSSTYEQLVAKMKGEIDKGQVTISELKGKLTVNMVEAILFDSGKAEVKSEGLVVLGKVIEILKTVSDKSIRIEGHTDNKPIVGTLTQRYPTNWELSAALSPEAGHRAGQPLGRRLRRVQTRGRQHDAGRPRQEPPHRDRPGPEGVTGVPAAAFTPPANSPAAFSFPPFRQARRGRGQG